MHKELAASFVCLLMIFHTPVMAQSHTSVPLESHVYYVLEQAELRGLCSPLSGIRPYTRNVIITIINEILNSDNAHKLKATERDILDQYLEKYAKPKQGMDWQKGIYHGETSINNFPLSLNIGGNLSMEGSAGLYDSSEERYLGTEVWLGFYLNGDLGKNVSWEFSGEGGLMKVPRKPLGEYNTYYEGFVDHDEYQNQYITVYSEPLAHFPYTYKKRWDASVHPLGDLSDFSTWPNSVSGAYNLTSELSVSLLQDKLFFRLGRLSHEWGSTHFGSSLVLNQMARPFLAIEAEYKPLSWFSIATMTGFLEFFNTKGEKESGMTFQNAYSISMMQFRYKNIFFLDLGEAVVWPKRFELGYMSPITNTIFYKNNVGDFDNLAAIVNFKAQFPPGSIWFSLFWDEAFWTKKFNELDRTMIALQAGIHTPLSFLSFSSLTISYTVINPYCYSHVRNFTPWYGDLLMEQAYVNNGVSLGYYLPPNSDEILLRFKTMPVKNVTALLQYQLIRHGADFGPSAVDGSNLLSELDPDGRDGSNPVLKRFFLQDGAYQWMHIFKVGAEWNIPNLPLPVSLYGEAGINYSYFTNINEKANVTGEAHPYSIIATPDYPKSTGFIVHIGVKVYSR